MSRCGPLSGCFGQAAQSFQPGGSASTSRQARRRCWRADWEQRLRATRQAIQFLPLIAGQLLTIVAIYWTARGTSPGPGSALLDLGVDEQQQSGRADQDAQDPEAQPSRVGPDTGP